MANTRDIDRLTPEGVMDYENGFYWFAVPSRMAKLCAHHELIVQAHPGTFRRNLGGVFKANTFAPAYVLN